MTPEKGTKYDGGKFRYTLLPVKPVQEIIVVLMFDADKYSEDNWQAVPDATRRYPKHLTVTSAMFSLPLS